MKIISKDRSSVARVGAEGALLVLSPLPFLLAAFGDAELFYPWRMVVAFLAAFACVLCSLTLFRLPGFGKLCGTLSSFGCFILAWPSVAADPFVALVSTIILIRLEMYKLLLAPNLQGQIFQNIKNM